MNRNARIELEGQLEPWVARCKKSGLTLEMLLAMAEILQRELSINRTIPHSDALELIMRAVAGTLDGTSNSYILNKLSNGQSRLESELT